MRPFKLALALCLFANTATATPRPAIGYVDNMAERMLTPALQGKSNLSNYQSALRPLGYYLEPNTQTAIATVRDSKTHEVAFQFDLATEEKLKQYRPTKLRKKLKEEAIKISQIGKAAFSQTVRSLPVETGSFLIGIGGVVAMQMLMFYEDNPMAMMQNLQNQVSPLGMATFGMFMMTQGVVSNVLSMYNRNPQFAKYIPFIGMGAGAFVQTYISSFATDPNVKACASQLWAKSALNKPSQVAWGDEDPCDKAYDYFVIHKKIYEYSPGLLSVIASAFASGKIFGTLADGTAKLISRETLLQDKLNKVVAARPGSKFYPQAAKALKSSTMRISALDVLAYLNPVGGIQIKGLRYLLVSSVKAGAFVALNTAFEHHSAWLINNAIKAPDISTASSELIRSMIYQKEVGWMLESEDFLKKLRAMGEKGQEWRQFNLSKVYTAYTAWEEALESLVKSYNTSHQIYSDFLGELSSAVSGEENRLEMAYPLQGTIAQGLKEEKLDNLHVYPEAQLIKQHHQSMDVGLSILEKIKSGAYKNSGMLPHEIEDLKTLANLFADEDVNKSSLGLTLLNRSIENSERSMTSYTPVVSKELRRIKESLGAHAAPKMGVGQGFFATMELAPKNSIELNQDFATTPYPLNFGLFKNVSLTDYMLLQTICGTNFSKSESPVKQVRGFQAYFVPPMIRNPDDDLGQICETNSFRVNADKLYTFPIVSKSGKTYMGVVPYLKENVQKDLLNPSTFESWWKNNTEHRLQAAFDNYQTKYNTIIASLVETVARKDNSSINNGPLANGTFKSIQQEARLYSMILGEIIKDLHKSNGTTLGKNLFDPNMEPAVVAYADDVRNSVLPNAEHEVFPILKLLGRSNTLEFDRLAQPFGNYSALQRVAKKPFGYRLKVQTEIDKNIAELGNYLMSIKVQKSSKDSDIISPAQAIKITAAHKALLASINSFQQLFPMESQTGQKWVMTEKQKKVVKHLIGSLTLLSDELLNMAAIIKVTSMSEKIKNQNEQAAAHKDLAERIKRESAAMMGK